MDELTKLTINQKVMWVCIWKTMTPYSTRVGGLVEFFLYLAQKGKIFVYHIKMASRAKLATQICLPQHHLTSDPKEEEIFQLSLQPSKYSQSICPSAMAFSQSPSLYTIIAPNTSNFSCTLATIHLQPWPLVQNNN